MWVMGFRVEWVCWFSFFFWASLVVPVYTTCVLRGALRFFFLIYFYYL
jgi:hypothetical protein